MIGGIILIFLLYGISIPILESISNKFKFLDVQLLKNLFWYHFLFWAIYFLYATFFPSDSKGYFFRSSTAYTSWLSIYTTGTRFIDFVAYPFSAQLHFTYEMMMVFFAWLGYWGFVCFYIFFKENIKFTHKLNNIDILSIIMFLPNMHFWTVSLGKGSIIFLGIGLTTYAISSLATRKISLILGLLIVYHVRPHVFLFLLVGIFIAFFTGKKGISRWQKYAVLVIGVVVMFILYDKILKFAGLDSENVVESFENFSSSRSFELAKARSGVDISNYPLWLKLVTFWFRPLFFDSPGILGVFVSCENLIYLILFSKILRKGFIKFLLKGKFLVTFSFVTFIAASIALSSTMSNLGIIIRQKSMVMYFFFFIILAFIDYEKMQGYIKKKKALERKKRLEQQALSHTT